MFMSVALSLPLPISVFTKQILLRQQQNLIYKLGAMVKRVRVRACLRSDRKYVHKHV